MCYRRLRCCQTALDRTRRRRRFNHSIAACTGELRPHMADDLEVLRNILELFRDVIPEMAKRRHRNPDSNRCVRLVRDLFALEMFRVQRLCVRNEASLP